jgi:hypothetical protein
MMQRREVSKFMEGLKRPEKSFEDQWQTKFSKNLVETENYVITQKRIDLQIDNV